MYFFIYYLVYRNKVRYGCKVRKQMNTNPTKGPLHFHSPAKIFHKTVRGMIPYKTERGVQALKRLTVFEGVPPQFEKVKRMVVPAALRIVRLRPDRKYTVLGDLAKLFGWTHQGLIAVFFIIIIRALKINVVNVLKNTMKLKLQVKHNLRFKSI